MPDSSAQPHERLTPQPGEPSPTGDIQDAHALRTVLDHLPLMVCWKDRDRRIQGCNRGFTDALGLSSVVDVLGKRDAEYLDDPKLTAWYRECDEKVLNTGEPLLNFEETVVDPQGNERHLLTSKVPVRDARGKVTAVLALAYDISEQKRQQDETLKVQQQAEAALTAANRKERVLRDVLETIPHHVFWKDRNCVYLGCNENFARAAGVASPADIVGRSDFELSRTREEARFYRRCDREVMEKGEPLLNVEEPQTDAHGVESWLQTSKVPLHDDAGEVVGILGVYTYITERRKAEQERKAMQDQLISGSRAAGAAEVATGVLHNVGNALNSINVATQLIADRLGNSPVATLTQVTEALRPAVGDFAGFVKNQPRAEALPGLLVELGTAITGEYSALTQEVVALREQLEHVKQVVAAQQSFACPRGDGDVVTATELMNAAVRLSGVTQTRPGLLSIDDDPAHTTSLRTDRHLVLQVLVNLINNAAQAVSRGRDEGAVRLACQIDQGQGTACFRVTDNGKGIDAPTMAQLFEHGFTTRSEGHGFGLHGARRVAGELNGTLVAASDGLDQGASFSFTLPLRPRGDHDGQRSMTGDGDTLDAA